MEEWEWVRVKPGVTWAALRTRMSIVPSSWTMVFRRAVSVMETAKVQIFVFGNSVSSSDSAASRRSCRRARMAMIEAPALAKALAVSRPMPSAIRETSVMLSKVCEDDAYSLL